MRFLFLGSPSYAVMPLQAIVAAGYHVVAVVTQPDRPAGRKRVLTPPPVKVAAQTLGIPVMQPATLRDPSVVAQVRAFAPDIGIVAAYGEILQKKMLTIPPHGYLNIHPSLLPRYRGPAPVAGAILAGDAETGVTIMKLERAMDSGDIVAQKRLPLAPTARTGQLTDMLFEEGATLLLTILDDYLTGTISPTPQDHTHATITTMLKKSDGRINWHLPADHLERTIRAYDPWPGTHTTWQGQMIKILAASVEPHSNYTHTYAPGTICGVPDTLSVVTANKLLTIHTVQPAGKRVMTAIEWLIGHTTINGEQFV